MLCQSPFKDTGSKSERPSELVHVNIVDTSAPVRISANKDVHQGPKTESQVIVEPGMVFQGFKSVKAFVQTSRGEKTFPSFLDLKGCFGCVKRVQELISAPRFV